MKRLMQGNQSTSPLHLRCLHSPLSRPPRVPQQVRLVPSAFRHQYHSRITSAKFMEAIRLLWPLKEIGYNYINEHIPSCLPRAPATSFSPTLVMGIFLFSHPTLQPAFLSLRPVAGDRPYGLFSFLYSPVVYLARTVPYIRTQSRMYRTVLFFGDATCVRVKCSRKGRPPLGLLDRTTGTSRQQLGPRQSFSGSSPASPLFPAVVRLSPLVQSRNFRCKPDRVYSIAHRDR